VAFGLQTVVVVELLFAAGDAPTAAALDVQMAVFMLGYIVSMHYIVDT
jgi:hypothetical protein